MRAPSLSLNIGERDSLAPLGPKRLEFEGQTSVLGPRRDSYTGRTLQRRGTVMLSRIAGLTIVALLAALTACGGGGSGAATPTVTSPGGGAAPGPAGPTAAPTSSASPAPTSSAPPPSTPGITMLPDTSGRFGLIQILDDYGGTAPLTTSQIQQEAPHYDSVWGAFFPSTWESAHPGMIVSRYVLPNEDESLISGHDLAWWQSNHPDWILYGCDSNGNPTHDLAYGDTHFNDVPLDIHNPQVVQYQIEQLLGPYMIANGYNALAIDNVDFVNYLGSPNPNFGEGDPQPGWYGCGIWQGSSFVYRYGGPGIADQDTADPNFIADILNWVATAHSDFATDPALAPYHLKIIVNHSFQNTPDANDQTLLQNVDAEMDENGFTHYGEYAISGSLATFQHMTAWMEYLQQHHVAAMVTDYFCRDGVNPATGAACSDDVSTLSPAQIDWALSTYALVNEGGADLYISPNRGSTYSYRREFATTLGAPCGEYTSSGALYYRKFAGALVVVNPSNGSEQPFSLPAGHSYTDIEGRPVSNPLEITGPDGYVLLTSNGCS